MPLPFIFVALAVGAGTVGTVKTIEGLDDMFTFGADYFGKIEADAWDYDAGYDAGYDVGVDADINSSIVNFNNGLENWIVPAIIIVLLFGV